MRCQDKVIEGRDRPLFGRRRGIARRKGKSCGGETEGGQRLDGPRSHISTDWSMSALGQSPGTSSAEKRIGSGISAGGYRTYTPARSAAYVRELANCRGTQYQTSVEPFATFLGTNYTRHVWASLPCRSQRSCSCDGSSSWGRKKWLKSGLFERFNRFIIDRGHCRSVIGL